MISIFEQLHQLAAGEPAALGIITRSKGSSPQKAGAKAIFFPDGKILGTMGGGCLEAEIQDRARRSLQTGQPASFELVLDHDFGWDDGLICGGKVFGLILPKPDGAAGIWEELAQRRQSLTWGVRPDFSIGWAAGPVEDWIYQETVHPPCALWIAGAGHVSQAVAPLALNLDFQVTVLDDRPALANHQHFPAATQFRLGTWEEILSLPMTPVATFGLIVTRGHRHDALVLRHWIQRPFQFLGMIGSPRKARIIKEQFLSEGLATAAELERVACPVGLDILAVSVPEIAVSIMGQFIQKRAGQFDAAVRHRPGQPESQPAPA